MKRASVTGLLLSVIGAACSHASSQIELAPYQPDNVQDASVGGTGGTSSSGGTDIVPNGIDRRPAAVPYLGFPELASISTLGWGTAEAFPGLSFDLPLHMEEAPGTGYLFIGEREGKMYAFANDPDVTEKTLVLDLSAHVQGQNDSGCLGSPFTRSSALRDRTTRVLSSSTTPGSRYLSPSMMRDARPTPR